MILSANKVLLAMAALLSSEGALGFSPRLKPSLRVPAATSLPTKLFSSTLEETNEDTVADKNEAPREQAKQKAMDALERLLSRQQAEMEQTKRLLGLYETFDTTTPSNSTDFTDSKFVSSELLSVASSILKGFDYGFQSRSEGPKFDLKGGNQALVGYGPPANIVSLGSQQFMRNLDAMRNEYTEEKDVELTPKQVKLQEKLQQLTLNSTAIWQRELKDGPIEAPWLIKVPYLLLCYMLDEVFEGRYVPSRFFLLETVARMPYFAYIGMLHLYETLGFWRRSADMKRIHFAEELNEFRHLLIMESLGGDQAWWVRFMAQHSAIAYFAGLCVLWCISPSLSYKFSELLETHAVNTYSQFLDENEDALKDLPPSLAAVDYYALGASDPYYAEFQTSAISKQQELRRPGLQMESLYDVFSAIRDDEGDHVGTMEACLDPTVAKLSPSLERKVLTGIATAAAVAFFLNGGDAGTVDVDQLVDGVDFAADETVATSVVDGTIAAIAGIASQLGQDTGDESAGAGIFADIFEEGSMSALADFLAEVLVIFSRFFF
ncbi:Ubiquinol oxidase [Seminavis robusta]|uniref:Ubiquinol oxidase n=1 Tax=Seminavis robusta TaxID=568900 RepID=A0A9N8DB31_9STRA|nr:Ubiquinol oxidase [Seminavis robusta]|eukprot:Sro5_g004330.1 Ubiquinol oxidase (549) ;mRNA; f:126287-128214